MRGKSNIEEIKLFGDFETTVLDENNKPFKNKQLAKSKVYLWCLVDSNYNKLGYGFSIDTFYDFITELNNKCIIKDRKGRAKVKYKYIIYFHNLSKWDGGFIISYFLKRGISFDKLTKLQTIYSLKWENIEFRDSLNIINASVKSIGEELNTLYTKTSIDYQVGYNHEATEKEIEYCFNDCLVVAEGINNFTKMVKEVYNELDLNDIIDKVDKSLTISGMAFKGFTASSNYKEECERHINSSTDNLLRDAYYGGYVYSNYRKGCYKGKVKMFDENSMYPDKYAKCKLPFGACKSYSGSFENYKVNGYDFYIMEILINKAKLKQGFPPIIPSSVNSFRDVSYVEEIEELTKYTVCNIDFDRWLKYYDIDYEITAFHCFRTKENYYKKWADKLIELKSKSKGIKRFVVKQLLNAPYGKLAMSGENKETEYFLNENDIISERITGETLDEFAFKYLPQAIAITAYARADLFDFCESVGWENVLYCDTDSCKFIYNADKHTNDKLHNIDINNSGDLGLWKLEGEPELFKTLAPKKYVFYENGVIEFACAGFRKDEVVKYFVNKYGGKIVGKNKDHIECDYETANIIIDNFTYNLKIPQLIKNRVNGGYILFNGVKEIKQPRGCNDVYY